MQINWSPLTCIFNNNPPGTCVVGVPGAGKSFFLENVAANVIEQGARLFVLDAKNDMIPLKYMYPDIDLIDVNDISPGSLDPFQVFGKDIDTTTLLTVTEIIVGELTPDQKLAITPIINDFVNRVKNGKVSDTSFRKFTDYLFANQNVHAQMVGNSLQINENSKYGPLIFGEAGVKNKKIKMKTKSTIISILGMTLPSGSAKPKPDELVNAAIVYIICKMIKDLLVKKNPNDKTPTLFMLDECHMLLRSQAIADIIDEFLVLGRSLGICLVLASQNVTHFSEDIAQLVSTKIAFRLSKKETEEFFDLFDTSTSGEELDKGEIMDIVPRLKTGYCLMIDARGRGGVFHVTSNFGSEMSSNPLTKNRK